MSEKYEKFEIFHEEVNVLLELEKIINKPFEKVYEIGLDTCGIVVDSGNIVGLGLFGCGLTDFPESILKLKTLHTLNLADNKLTILPDSIFELNLLKKLELSLNNLKTLPNSIGKLISLKKLILEQNQLQTLPETIGNLKKLKTLNLEENQLTTIPDSIGSLSSLIIIKLSNNQLTTIPESIGSLEALERLELINNKLTSLPWTVWQIKNLKYLNLDNNSWKEEWEELAKRDLPSILNYCQKRASINVFLSHAIVDFDYFRINAFTEFLEKQNEIYHVFYCETDLKGNIDDFMNETVPKCQLLLFFASKKSVFNSVDCVHELELARKNNIQIIPIKGADVGWEDLKRHNLDRLLGHEFDGDNFIEFCGKIYEYIKQFKRDVNLFEPEEAKFDKEKLNVKNLITNYLDSEEFKNNLRKNLIAFNELFQKVSSNQISMNEYFENLTKLINQKS